MESKAPLVDPSANEPTGSIGTNGDPSGIVGKNEQDGWRQSKRASKLADVSQGDVALPAFHSAHVTPGQSTLRSQTLLGPTPTLSNFTQSQPKLAAWIVCHGLSPVKGNIAAHTNLLICSGAGMAHTIAI